MTYSLPPMLSPPERATDLLMDFLGAIGDGCRTLTGSVGDGEDQAQIS